MSQTTIDNPQNFNWKKQSWLLLIHYPQHFDPDKYNWEQDSWAVAEFCPEYLPTPKGKYLPLKKIYHFMVEYHK